MKAEKLKQKAYRKISNYVGGFWVEYHFNEKELQQYAAEVSREAFTDGWTSAWREENEQSIARSSYLDREFKLVDEYYDEFIKEQEEQQ